MTIPINTDYRKDHEHPAGYGYGRDIAPEGAKEPHWVAGRSDTVTSVIIHATHGNENSKPENEAKFLRDSPNVSATFLIGRDLMAYQILPDYMVPWHAGRVLPGFENDQSLGFELHAAKTEPILPGQIELLEAILREKIPQYKIPRSLLDTHRAVALPAKRKSDPLTWKQSDFIVWREALYRSLPPRPAPTPEPGPPTPSPRYTEESPFLGPMAGDPERIITQILERPHGEYKDYDVRRMIVPTYYAICAEVGIDPVLAIAQMIHETGNLTSFWAARNQRNPAGIGVNGRVAASKLGPDWAFDGMVWRAGVSFQRWDSDSIPAHLGRLLAYALTDTDPELHRVQRELIDKALSYRPLDATVRGSAQTLKQLGQAHNPSGKGWAKPGTDYGVKIAAIANRLIG